MIQIANRRIEIGEKKKEPIERGTWGGIQRARKGLHYYTDMYGGSSVLYGSEYERTNRTLSDGELWEVYRRCSDVRAAIDSIVRRVATFDWLVEPIRSPQEEGWAELNELSKTGTAFLNMPNKNGQTWQEIMTAFLTDVLVFDRLSLRADEQISFIRYAVPRNFV